MFKNAYVFFCPNNRFAFKLGLDKSYINHSLNCGCYGYLMKKVVVITGDIISTTKADAMVNQTRIPFSKPKLKDGLNCLLSLNGMLQIINSAKTS